MSAPSTPSASTSSKLTPSSTGVGAFGALAWGVKRLVTAPALLVFVVVAGSGLGLVQLSEYGPALLLLVTLFVTAVTFRYAGLTHGDIDDGRALAVGTLRSVPRLVGVWIWFTFGLVVIFYLVLLTGVVGALLALPAIVLFPIHTMLAFPAVCIDQNLMDGLIVGWDYARSARTTLLGLVIVTAIPLLVLNNLLTDSDPVVLVGFGAAHGCVLAATNLAFARVYVGQRSLRESN